MGDPSTKGGTWNMGFSPTWFSWNRTRDRLLLFVFLVALIPGILVGVFASLQVKRAMTDQALVFQKTISQSVCKGFTARVRGFQDLLADLAGHPEMQSMDPARQRTVLYQFLDHHPAFFSFFVYDSSGVARNFAFRNRLDESGLLGRNLHDGKTPWVQELTGLFENVLKTGDMRVDSKVSVIKGRAQLMILVPIRDFLDPAKITGVLSSSLDIDGQAIQELMAGIDGTDQGFLLITDGEGTPMFRRGRNLPAGLEKVTLSRTPEPGAEESAWTEVGGMPFLVFASRIPELNAFLLVGARRDEVLGTIDRTVGNMLILTLMLSILAALVGGSLAGTLVDPIQRLLEGIRKVSEGAVSHRVEVTGPVEIAETSKAFNELTRQLEKNRLLEDIWGDTWKQGS